MLIPRIVVEEKRLYYEGDPCPQCQSLSLVGAPRCCTSCGWKQVTKTPKTTVRPAVT